MPWKTGSGSSASITLRFPHFRFVVYFVEDGLTVVAPILLVAGLGIHPTHRAWLRAFLQLHVVAGVAALVNLVLGTNFMYLRSKPAGPTPFDLFGPWPVYLLVLELLVLVVFRLLQWALRVVTPGGLDSVADGRGDGRQTDRLRSRPVSCQKRIDIAAPQP